MTPLLLHACCGPCSLEPVKLLRAEGFEPTICWTNPNIQPVSEWQRRLNTLRTWADEVAHVEVTVAGDNRAAWEAAAALPGFDRERRCRACYALRLAESCRVAQERGFEHISTTLVVSPYQLFDACGEICAPLRRATASRRSGETSARTTPRQRASPASWACIARATVAAASLPPRRPSSATRPETSASAPRPRPAPPLELAGCKGFAKSAAPASPRAPLLYG